MTVSTISPPQIQSSSSTSSLTVLHLAGSFVSDFYYNLSIIYAKEVIKPVGVENHYAIIHPDGQWQLGKSLEHLSEKMPLQNFIEQLPKIDLVVPHLFCLPGMTSFRAFFEDILGIPLVGSRSNCTAIAANKAQTRSIVANAGVKVAKGQLLSQGDSISLKPPFIVKPNAEDNSLGITLVKTEAEIPSALELGFEFDNQLLVEEFIPGRELRVAVIERQGKLEVLPMIEYLVTEDNPIRTTKDKLDLQADGMPTKQPEKPTVKSVCPAQVTPELTEKLATAATQAHLALGCRDYSLYDFRVHEATNEPYLLEAGLFWSFSHISMISRMLAADNQKLADIVLELWQNAAKRTRVACGSLFKEARL